MESTVIHCALADMGQYGHMAIFTVYSLDIEKKAIGVSWGENPALTPESHFSVTAWACFSGLLLQYLSFQMHSDCTNRLCSSSNCDRHLLACSVCQC